MHVVKRDGTREEVRIEKILHAVNRACRGLNNVDAIEVAKSTINGLHDGSTTEELDALSISNAVMLMGEEPNYSKVAARMLAESIRKEAGRDSGFRDYIKAGYELGLLHPKVFELALQDDPVTGSDSLCYVYNSTKDADIVISEIHFLSVCLFDCSTNPIQCPVSMEVHCEDLDLCICFLEFVDCFHTGV